MIGAIPAFYEWCISLYIYTPLVSFGIHHTVLFFATPSLIFEATSLRQLTGLTFVPKLACRIA